MKNSLIFWTVCGIHTSIILGFLFGPHTMEVTPLRVFLRFPFWGVFFFFTFITFGVIVTLIQNKVTYFHLIFLVLQQLIVLLTIGSIITSIINGTGSFGDPRPRLGVLFTNISTVVLGVFHTIALIQNILAWGKIRKNALIHLLKVD